MMLSALVLLAQHSLTLSTNKLVYYNSINLLLTLILISLQGCTDKFVETLKQHVMIVTGVTIAIIAMEVLGIIFSLVLCFAINRSERYKA